MEFMNLTDLQITRLSSRLYSPNNIDSALMVNRCKDGNVVLSYNQALEVIESIMRQTFPDRDVQIDKILLETLTINTIDNAVCAIFAAYREAKYNATRTTMDIVKSFNDRLCSLLCKFMMDEDFSNSFENYKWAHYLFKTLSIIYCDSLYFYEENKELEVGEYTKGLNLTDSVPIVYYRMMLYLYKEKTVQDDHTMTMISIYDRLCHDTKPEEHHNSPQPSHYRYPDYKGYTNITDH